MYSYEEFPEQVKNAVPEFVNRFDFELVDEIEDHHLCYQNDKWRVYFICDHGALEIYLKNIADNKEYYLPGILEFWFPKSRKAHVFPTLIWGSEETVNYQVETLTEFFAGFDKNYELQKKNFWQHKEYNEKVFSFVMNSGSKELKELFRMKHPNWKRLALNEMKNSK